MTISKKYSKKISHENFESLSCDDTCEDGDFNTNIDDRNSDTDKNQQYVISDNDIDGDNVLDGDNIVLDNDSIPDNDNILEIDNAIDNEDYITDIDINNFMESSLMSEDDDNSQQISKPQLDINTIVSQIDLKIPLNEIADINHVSLNDILLCIEKLKEMKIKVDIKYYIDMILNEHEQNIINEYIASDCADKYGNDNLLTPTNIRLMMLE